MINKFFILLLIFTNLSIAEESLYKIKCDLSHNDCKLKDISASLHPTPPKSMSRISLKLSGDIKSPLVIIRGINMDMGDVTVKFKKQNNEWVGQFALGHCIMGDMKYSVTLYDNEKLLGEIGYFDIKN